MRLAYLGRCILVFVITTTLVMILRLHDSSVTDKTYRQHFEDDWFIGERQRADTTDEDGIIPFVIVTVRRSGSTLLGDILQTDPNTFYMFEPFHKLAMQRKQLITYKEQRIFLPKRKDHLILEKIFNCNFSKSKTNFLHPFLKFSRAAKPFLDCYKKSRIRNRLSHCEHIITRNCKKSEFRFVKTVRLPMKHLSYFMDKYPNMKIIHLIRDPRASMKSSTYSKNITKSLCDIISDNIRTESTFRRKYPGRIRRVYFEEMASDPIQTTKNLYNFIGLNFDKNVESYIHDITSAGNQDGTVGSMRPNSKRIIYEWRRKISFGRLAEVQNFCSDVFENTWYIKCNNIKTLVNYSIPLYW